MKSDKVNNYLFWIVIFLTFLGFYAVLLLSINIGLYGFTRQLTIPMRMLIGLSCFLLFIRNYKTKSPHLIWFVVFMIVYLIRILIDYSNNEYFYLPYSDLVFYFISFAVIPFVALSKVTFSMIDFEKTYKVFLFSALVFLVLSILLYGEFIGKVSRLSSSAAGEDVISPLILSYCGSLVIGICSTFLIYNKRISKAVRLFSFVAIAMAIVPFFLGASRGGILAVLFPFILLAVSNLSFKNIIKYVLLSTIIILVLIYLDEHLRSGLLQRFTGTAEAIETGGSSASRLGIWKKSFVQFTYHPIFGDKLNTVEVNHYPHNIYIEVLQSVGIIGFIPFLILVFKGVKASIDIFKHHLEYAWIPVFFLQATMQNMFSGALYTAAWFWTSLGLVLSLHYYLKKNEIKNL